MKRYDIVGQWQEQENELGDWVEAHDVLSLQAERDRLREALGAIGLIALNEYMVSRQKIEQIGYIARKAQEGASA